MPRQKQKTKSAAAKRFRLKGRKHKGSKQAAKNRRAFRAHCSPHSGKLAKDRRANGSVAKCNLEMVERLLEGS